MTSSEPNLSYRFGPWRYQPSLRLLSSDNGEQRIKPLSDKLLRRLLDDPGEVLTRDQLLDEVWTRKQVNDEVLSRAIAELRAVLGDDARQPKFIETLAKGGYRWIAETQRLPNLGASEAPAVRDPTAANRRILRSPLAWGLCTVLGITAIWAYSQFSTGPSAESAVATIGPADLLLARPLTAHPALELDPSFDPIGRVVYIRADPEKRLSELVMVSAEGDAERVLWEHSGLLRNPAVSPDGSEVALVRRTDDGGCEVFAVSVLDQRETSLARCPERLYGGVAWTLDGESLIYTAQGDAEHAPGLALLNRRSGQSGPLTRPTTSEGAHLNPRLSPNGKTLVYASRHGSDRQLWWTDWPAMSKHQALLGRPEPVYSHAFAPDSQSLLVAGDLVSYRAINRLRPGMQPELIGGRGAQSIDIASDGSAVWSAAIHDADVLLGEENMPSSWHALAKSNRYEAQPAFSADGQSVAMVSNRGGTESVIVLRLDNADTLDLRLDPEQRWVRPTWSPDGRSLIVSGYLEKHTQLYRYRFEGDVLTPIEGPAVDAFAGIELRDRLLYIGGEGPARVLKQLHTDGKIESLPIGPIASFRASEDWLVWNTPAGSRLWATPVGRWDQAQAVGDTDRPQGEAYALVGNQLYYAFEQQLWSKQLPDGAPKALADVPYPTGHGPNLAVSARGEFAVSMLQSVQMDLMIATRKPATLQ